MHASRNAPAWLFVVAPDAWELAMALGTRPVSRAHEVEEESGGDSGNAADKNARVLTTALEIVLVVLDTCVELEWRSVAKLGAYCIITGRGRMCTGAFALLERGYLSRGAVAWLKFVLKRWPLGR